MEKRYQVFVSSTFEDLQVERQEVMQALLELDCIPAGMELFPATNETQWEFIKKIISDCDYYVVIIGGRYGSIGPHGIGYTEMEYRYAKEIKKPTIGFLHKDPDQLPVKRTERTPEGQQLLWAFRSLVGQNLCKLWSNPQELGSVVSRGLVQLMKNSPGIGWVRADSMGDPSEVLKLRRQIEELQQELRSSVVDLPKGTEGLAQGDDLISITCSYEIENKNTRGPKIKKPTVRINLSWNTICFYILPSLLQEGSDGEIYVRLKDALANNLLTEDDDKLKSGKISVHVTEISREDIDTITVQLQALGLIIESKRNRYVRDTGRYWKLTPYGVQIMTRLRAVRRRPS